MDKDISVKMWEILKEHCGSHKFISEIASSGELVLTKFLNEKSVPTEIQGKELERKLRYLNLNCFIPYDSGYLFVTTYSPEKLLQIFNCVFQLIDAAEKRHTENTDKAN